MIFPIFVLFVAICISCVAAYYSVVGLTTIFSGAVLAVAIMGGALEIGKLVAATWLHVNWKKAPVLLKTYLCAAVSVLMFITSMGIFGYLSKAHIQQAANTGDNTLKVELIDNKIIREQKRITDAEAVIAQLDKAVKILQDYDRVRGPTGAIAVRKNQQEERAELNSIIEEASDVIAELQERKIILESKQIAMKAEFGPITYIAAMVYGEEDAEGMMDDAVRAVILTIIFVFDPLAVSLLLAGVWSFEQVKEKKNKNVTKELPTPVNGDGGESFRKQMEDEAKELIKSPGENGSTTSLLDNKLDKFSEDVERNKKEAERIHALYKKRRKESEQTLKRAEALLEEHKPIKKPEEPLKGDPLPSLTQEVAKDITKDTSRRLALTEKDFSDAIEDAFDKTKGNANIPFNLSGTTREALKKILVEKLKDKQHKD